MTKKSFDLSRPKQICKFGIVGGLKDCYLYLIQRSIKVHLIERVSSKHMLRFFLMFNSPTLTHKTDPVFPT